jgi:hypothetical protein
MADTVIDPWAMVVHPENTKTALRAVMCSGWLPISTFFALFTVFDLHVLTLKRGLHACWNSARVCKASSNVTNVSKHAKRIEGDKVKKAPAAQRNA